MLELLIIIAVVPLFPSSTILTERFQSYYANNWIIKNIPTPIFTGAPILLDQTTEIMDPIKGTFKMRYNYSAGTFPQVKKKCNLGSCSSISRAHRVTSLSSGRL